MANQYHGSVVNRYTFLSRHRYYNLWFILEAIQKTEQHQREKRYTEVSPTDWYRYSVYNVNLYHERSISRYAQIGAKYTSGDGVRSRHLNP